MTTKQQTVKRLQQNINAIENRDLITTVERLESVVKKLRTLAEQGERDRFRHGVSFLSGEASVQWEKLRPKP